MTSSQKIRTILGASIAIIIGVGALCVLAQTRRPSVCPSDYDAYYSHAHKCYKHYSNDRSWDDARTHCREQGADLFLVQDAQTSNFLEDNLAPLQQQRQQWMGLREISDKVFRWTDGNPVAFQRWENLEEPSNGVVNGKDCGLFDSTSYWTDIPCDLLNPYSCQKLPEVYPACPTGYVSYSRNRKCVRAVHDVSKTWNDARRDCQKDGGDLILITGDAYNTFIKTLLKQHRRYWIGFHDPAYIGFRWIDGTEMSYEQWAPNQPDYENFRSNVVCGEISIIEGFDGWNDILCSKTTPYICEKSYVMPMSCLAGEQATAQGDDWVLDRRSNKCYKIQNETKTLNESETDCQQQGGSLASVEDPLSQDYVTGLIEGLGSLHWVQHRVDASPYSCMGAVLQNDPPFINSDVCEARHASVCERQPIRDHPVLECPYGYTTYVTTTTGWQIICVMAESHRKKTREAARMECDETGGDLFLYDQSESDLLWFIKEHNLLSSSLCYWIHSGCAKKYHTDALVFPHPCPLENNYICQHWGIITDVVQLRNIRGLIVKDVHDSVVESNSIPLTEVCRVSDMAELYANHAWIRTSPNVSFRMEVGWNPYVAEDKNARCLYNEGRDCCAEVVFTKPANLTHPFGMKISLPTDKLRCLCQPRQELTTLTETFELLRHLTTAYQNNSATPNNLCPCRCSSRKINMNPSPQELALILARIGKELRVEPRHLSLTRSKKVSAVDNRTQSRVMGYAGIGLCLVVPVCLLLLMDFSTLAGLVKQKHHL